MGNRAHPAGSLGDCSRGPSHPPPPIRHWLRACPTGRMSMILWPVRALRPGIRSCEWLVQRQWVPRAYSEMPTEHATQIHDLLGPLESPTSVSAFGQLTELEQANDLCGQDWKEHTSFFSHSTGQNLYSNYREPGNCSQLTQDVEIDWWTSSYSLPQ